ncbi:MAG: hypothetical protein EA382_01995 [Spirochaetaceae bacterium]|nr:MAG: hypothetical protein EA382_01995 [Spirochaetaceae bacterium]
MTTSNARCAVLVIALLAVAPAALRAQDVFRLYAPPGGVYANAALERDALVEVEITIEHQGAAVPEWFIAVSRGASSGFEPRTMASGASTMEYQIYGAIPPTSAVIKAPPETLSANNIVTSTDFATDSATTQYGTVSLWVHIPSGQFVASGEYTDSVTLLLYTGDYATPATHVLADSAVVSMVGRMARLLDIYAVREPGIRTMDLTATVADRLIATIHERSNSATGYTVTLSSANLTADSGQPGPFFLHGGGSERLPYSLTYGGAAVVGWSGGAAVVTDSDGITASGWLTRELRIAYAGSDTLAAGDYQDVLTVTISAK